MLALFSEVKIYMVLSLSIPSGHGELSALFQMTTDSGRSRRRMNMMAGPTWKVSYPLI